MPALKPPKLPAAMKGIDLALQIQKPMKINNIGSTLLSAIAASLLIAWSVWNNRPSESSPPKEDLAQVSEHSEAQRVSKFGDPVQLNQHGVFDPPMTAADAGK